MARTLEVFRASIFPPSFDCLLQPPVWLEPPSLQHSDFSHSSTRMATFSLPLSQQEKLRTKAAEQIGDEVLQRRHSTAALLRTTTRSPSPTRGSSSPPMRSIMWMPGATRGRTIAPCSLCRKMARSVRRETSTRCDHLFVAPRPPGLASCPICRPRPSLHTAPPHGCLSRSQPCPASIAVAPAVLRRAVCGPSGTLRENAHLHIRRRPSLPTRPRRRIRRHRSFAWVARAGGRSTAMRPGTTSPTCLTDSCVTGAARSARPRSSCRQSAPARGSSFSAHPALPPAAANGDALPVHASQARRVHRGDLRGRAT